MQGPSLSLSELPSLSNSQKRIMATLPPVISVQDDSQQHQGSMLGPSAWNTVTASELEHPGAVPMPWTNRLAGGTQARSVPDSVGSTLASAGLAGSPASFGQPASAGRGAMRAHSAHPSWSPPAPDLGPRAPFSQPSAPWPAAAGPAGCLADPVEPWPQSKAGQHLVQEQGAGAAAQAGDPGSAGGERAVQLVAGSLHTVLQACMIKLLRWNSRELITSACSRWVIQQALASHCSRLHLAVAT